MYRGTDPRIFDLNKLEFEDIQRLPHIRAYILVESHDILVNMNMWQILVLKYGIGCWSRKVRGHKDYLLGPLLEDNLITSSYKFNMYINAIENKMCFKSLFTRSSCLITANKWIP